MIYAALNYLVKDINRFLMRRFSAQSTKAILGSILNEDGVVPEENQNKMILTLVNLESNTTNHFEVGSSAIQDGSISYNRPFNFNLDVLVTASFTNYGEALKFLSETTYFFHGKPLFNSENSPGLDSNIQKFLIEIVKVDYAGMHALWTAIGTNYRPSFLIKIRMVTNDQNSISMSSPLVAKVDNLE